VLLIGPEYRAAIAFGVLFVILLVRPQGILGARA
jgi:branched-subunit amino acid ABC-type transport system permease component